MHCFAGKETRARNLLSVARKARNLLGGMVRDARTKHGLRSIDEVVGRDTLSIHPGHLRLAQSLGSVFLLAHLMVRTILFRRCLRLEVNFCHIVWTLLSRKHAT